MDWRRGLGPIGCDVAYRRPSCSPHPTPPMAFIRLHRPVFSAPPRPTRSLVDSVRRTATLSWKLRWTPLSRRSIWSPGSCRSRGRQTGSPLRRPGHMSRPNASLNGSSTTAFPIVTTAATHTTYYPGCRRQVLQEAMRLRDSGYTVVELTDRLAEMTAQIQDRKAEFDIESPTPLRGTLAEGGNSGWRCAASGRACLSSQS